MGDVKRLKMLADFLLISLFCILSLADLSEFFGGVENELFLEVQRHQHLRLLQIENSVAQIIKNDEEFGISNFTSPNSTSMIVGSFQTPITKGGEDSDPLSRARRKFIKEMMKHAWGGYVAHAWGQNEVRPVSKSANTGTIFGASNAGATYCRLHDHPLHYGDGG